MDEISGSLMVDEVARNGKKRENPRFLDPAATPEKLKPFPYVLGVPCPTRTMTRETGLALANLVKPMFGEAVPVSPDSKEVGEARNHIVDIARAQGVEAILFVDYDVAPPPNALVKMLSVEAPIVAGVYHLKQVPSYPLIYVKGWPGAFEGYKIGDYVKADGVGMGCTLIRMEVFDKIEKELGLPWFRTVPGYVDEDPSTLLPHMTEDIYFCDKARQVGYDIIVDTSVQCGHVDWVNGVHYYGEADSKGRVFPVWRYRKGDTWIVEGTASKDHPGARWAKIDPPNNEDKPVWLDLGSGGHEIEGYTGVDLYYEGPSTIKGDITDLSWYREEHGLVEKIRSSHSLEHMSHHDVPVVFRDWVNTLRPGGEMEVRVPDGEFHMRAIIERVDNEEDVDPQCDWLNATIYGYQIGEGQEHKTMFTKNRLEQLALTSGLKDVTVEKKVNKGNERFPDTGELILRGRRE